MSALLEQWPIGDGMWILVLTLFALRPSLQVYYSKTCGIMLRPDADVSLPRQSLLFSEDEELGRFSGKVDQTLLPVSHNHPLAYRVLPNGFDPRPPKQCRPCAV